MVRRLLSALSKQLCCLVLLLSLGNPAFAAEATDTHTNPIANYFSHWFDRVDKTSAEQPHWASSIVTGTPRLTELFRYDISWQSLKGGHDLVNYGSGKGLEFIPSEHIELFVGIPPYLTVNTNPRKSGFGDEFFLMKYRFLAANEQNGNYILTGFMGMTVPNGSDNFTTHHYVYSPSLTGGKGWGRFDIWGTAGVSIPDNFDNRKSAGLSVPANLVMQYKVGKCAWPQLEANYCWWATGAREGENQLFLTPGVVYGPFKLWHRLGGIIGAGVQVAVSDNPAYHRSVILSTRVVF